MIPPILAQENSKKKRLWVKQKKTESPNLNSKRQAKTKLTKIQLEKLFKEIDLSGIKDWSEEDQKEVKN